MIVRPVHGRELCGVCVNYINNKNAQKPTFITENNVSQHVLIWTSTLVLMWQINVVVVVVCCCVNAGYCCQSLVLLTADLRPALEPYLLLSALYGVFRLLPDLCRLPLGPEPEGVRVLLLVGTGIDELLGCLVFNGVGMPDGPETEVFLELGRDVLLVLLLAAVLLLRLVPDPDIQPTNTGMLDSDVLLIILLGLGVMYDLDLILAEKGVLSVELALSVLSRPPGVEVFLGTPEPKPMGLGRSVLLPDRMLEVLLTPDPRRPSSDSLRLMLEPYLLPGLEPWAEARLS